MQRDDRRRSVTIDRASELFSQLGIRKTAAADIAGELGPTFFRVRQALFIRVVSDDHKMLGYDINETVRYRLEK